MISRNFSLTCKRLLSTQKKNKTAIVLLNEGQPRSEYYAKLHLQNRALEYYNLPLSCKSLIPLNLLLNQKVRNCISRYGDVNTVEQDLSVLTDSLQNSLNDLVPEFGNITCASLFSSESTFDEQLEEIISSGIDNLIFLPSGAHFTCDHEGHLLNLVAQHLFKSTVAGSINGKPDNSIRIRPNTNISINVSAIHRWSTHPTLANFWTSIIDAQKEDFQGIVFSAPIIRSSNSKEYKASVWSTCERISVTLKKPVPWKLAFFNGWSEWDFPIRDSVQSQVKVLEKLDANNSRPIAIVPVTEYFPTFNSRSVLPDNISKISRAKILHPEAPNSIIVQGLTELVKNHLLGRRNPQLQLFCDGCRSKECDVTRALLAS